MTETPLNSQKNNLKRDH